MLRPLLSFVVASAFCASAHATRLDTMISYPTGPVSSNPRGLAAGDLNGDGKADVVVANFGAPTLIGQSTSQTAGSLQLFKGTGSGLIPWMVLPTGKSPRGVVIADLNGDGRPDIAATFYDDNAVGVYLQQSDGTFNGPITLAVGSHPVGLATGLLGGHPVLAVANYGSSTVSIVQVVAGSPTLLATVSVGANPTDVKFYSVPGAATQILAAAYGANQLTRVTLKSDGSSTSRVDSPLSGQPSKVVVADLNGDGHLDVAVAQFAESKVTVYLGQADGSLSLTGTSSALRGSHPNGLAYGALGATGRLVTADRDSDQLDLLQWTAQGLSSTAALTVPDAQGNTSAAGYGPIEAVMADVNGDGLDDLLVTFMRDGELKLFLQKPTAAPVITSSSHPVENQWYAATEAVFNWQAPADLDAITQYLSLFDQSPATFPAAGQGASSALEARYPGLASGTYYLHLRAVDAAGRVGETSHFKIGVTAALSKENVYNYPNPSRDGHTTIRFPLLAPAGVAIRIYDELGALVWTRDLGAAETVAGVNTLEWDGRNGNGQAVGNGGYIFTLVSGAFSVTKKIAIIR